MGVVALDDQPRRRARRLLRLRQHLAVTDGPLRHVDRLLRVLAFDHRHDVVRVDDEGVAIGQYRFRCRNRARVRQPDVDDRARGCRVAGLCSTRGGSGGGRTDGTGRSGREGALVAVDPHVGIGVASRVRRHPGPRFDTREVLAESPEPHLALLAAAPHLVCAALIVGAAQRDEARVVGPPWMVDLGVFEAWRLVERDGPPFLCAQVDERYVAVRAVEVPGDGAARGRHRRPAPVAERFQGLVRQLGDTRVGPGKEPGGEASVGRKLKGVRAHQRLVPDHFGLRWGVDPEAGHGREVVALVLVAGADVHPRLAAHRIVPDREREALPEACETGAVPPDDEQFWPAVLRPSGEHDPIAARCQQRLDVTLPLSQNHALALAFFGGEAHQDELVAGGERIGPVALHPHDPRRRAGELPDLVRRSRGSACGSAGGSADRGIDGLRWVRTCGSGRSERRQSEQSREERHGMHFTVLVWPPRC